MGETEPVLPSVASAVIFAAAVRKVTDTCLIDNFRVEIKVSSEISVS